MHYSMGKMRLPFIDGDLLYRSALYGTFDYFQEKNYKFQMSSKMIIFSSKKDLNLRRAFVILWAFSISFALWGLCYLYKIFFMSHYRVWVCWYIWTLIVTWSHFPLYSCWKVLLVHTPVQLFFSWALLW